MELKINIDEKELNETVIRLLAKEIVAEYGHTSHQAKAGIRDACDYAVREYIYKQKDKVIEKVVSRATREIVKKGLPKLLENIEKEEA